jgi:hypothetical protein
MVRDGPDDAPLPGISFMKLKGVEESVLTWVQLNACEVTPKYDVVSKEGDEMKVTRKTYGGGKNADLTAVVESLRLALSARNPDFEKGIFNADSSVEALIRVKMLPPHVAEKLADCKTNEDFETLERYAAEGFRARKTPLAPGAWGQLLAFRKEAAR